MEAGEIQQAISAFEAAVQQDAENSEAWRYLGQAQAENEHEQAAISALLKAIAIDPYNLQALMTIGVSYTNDLEQVRALNFLKTWLENNPDYNDLDMKQQKDTVKEYTELYGGGGDGGATLAGGGMSGFGMSAQMVDDTLHQEVLKMFEQASLRNPDDVDVHVVLGVLHCIKSNYDAAITRFERAVVLKPEDATLWNKLGATRANASNYDDAVQAYVKALELRPHYVRSLANLAIAFANQQQHEDAVKAYLAALNQNPEASHLWGYLRLSLSSLGKDDMLEMTHSKNTELFRPYFNF
jgi:peroxin-5